jgi:hypothetical protein
MKTKLAIAGLLIASVIGSTTSRTLARGDDFETVVKMIEQFYHVKHQSISFLARAGMKAAKTAARIRGGEYRQLAEAGSVRVAFFEDQEFNSRGQMPQFRASMRSALEQDWSALVQTTAPKDEEQNYIYLRAAGEKFHVMIVTIDRHEATVVRATIAPNVLEMLLKDPNETGKSLTQDATTYDPN